MGDYDSSLPVVGSQYITNTVAVSGAGIGVLGSVAVTSGYINVAASGTALAVSGILSVDLTSADYVSVVQSGTQWLVGGSVYTTGSINVTNLYAGSEVWQGTSPWVVLGSAAITNTVGVLGSVVVTNTVNVAQGARASTVQDYNTAVAVASAGSDIHYYKSTGSFYFERVEATASGKAKVVIGTGSPSVTAKVVLFNSTANPNVDMDFGANPLFIGSNTAVGIVRLNRDNQSQDLYSTIIGYYG